METIHERSYGIIPVKKKGNQWQICMVQLHAGHWGFPKGHPEDGEEPLEAATRELQEETSLHLNEIVTEEKFLEEYFFILQGKRIHKIVTYWIGSVRGRAKKQALEIKSIKWVSLEKALELATFKNTKNIILKVIKALA